MMPKRFVVEPGDKLLVEVEVLDAHDSGNIVLRLGGEYVRPSLADLEAVTTQGGRHVVEDEAPESA